MTVSTPALACPFTLAEDDRQMLLHGLDAIDLTLQHKDDLSGWFEHDMAARPWVYA
jgi:3-isopropylmalate/(R)-2-methylmalate dehydratase small subunit